MWSYWAKHIHYAKYIKPDPKNDLTSDENMLMLFVFNSATYKILYK